MSLAHHHIVRPLVEQQETLSRRMARRLLDGGSGVGATWQELEDRLPELLGHLSDAVAAGRPGLFRDYLIWARDYLRRRGRAEELDVWLQAAEEEIGATLDGELVQVVTDYLERARSELDSAPEGTSPDPGDNPLGDLHHRYLDALLGADRGGAARLVDEALHEGADVRDIYLYVFQAAQREMGLRWQRNEVSVAQEHFCTAATQLIMSNLYDRVFSQDRLGRRVVVCSVSGDLHEIGGRMVADFFEMEGWDTHYLGANTPPESVVEAVLERDAEGVALSATMTTHVRATAEIVDHLRAEPRSADRWVMVGGYPFQLDSGLWREVGADAMAADALGAVQVAAELGAGS